MRIPLKHRLALPRHLAHTIQQRLISPSTVGTTQSRLKVCRWWFDLRVYC